MQAFLDRWAVDNWRLAIKFWSVRVTVFWTLISTVYGIWPNASDYVPHGYYMVVSVVLGILVLFARLTKQPGLVENG